MSPAAPNNARLIAELQAVTLGITLVGLDRLPEVMRDGAAQAQTQDTTVTNTNTVHGGAVAWRYRHPKDDAWQLTQDHDLAFKNTGEVEPLGVIPFAPQTDTDAREKVVEALAEIERMEANARLIAAAPELLRQLQQVMACLEITGEIVGDMDAHRAAISRATGAA